MDEGPGGDGDGTERGKGQQRADEELLAVGVSKTVIDGGKNYDDKSEMAYYWLEANIGRVLLVVAFAWVGIWGFLLEGQEGLDPVRAFIRYLGAEMAGIGIGAIAIDALNEKRQRDNRKAQLIRQLGSRHPDVTEMARLELEHEEWLYDGALREAKLVGAELSGADLHDADLIKVVLTKAILTKAILPGANLTQANLRNADLSGAVLERAILPQANLREATAIKTDFTQANLTEASLGGANLSHSILWLTRLYQADLTRANLSQAELLLADLREAVLWQADLSNVKVWTVAQLEEAKTVEGAIMPDGVRLGEKGNERLPGPTFEEWKTHYLTQYGGAETDSRDLPNQGQVPPLLGIPRGLLRQ